MHIQVFNPHLSRLRALSPLLALLILALVVSGCAPYIAIPRSADAILAPAATVEPRQHALSILAVDFDPPLDGRSLSMGDAALLVSVRNEGLSDEHDVAITARLLDPASPGGQSEIYSDTVYAGVAPPGRAARGALYSGWRRACHAGAVSTDSRAPTGPGPRLCRRLAHLRHCDAHRRLIPAARP